MEHRLLQFIGMQKNQMFILICGISVQDTKIHVIPNYSGKQTLITHDRNAGSVFVFFQKDNF